MDSIEVLAAKWRVDPRADDAPTSEPMRSMVSPAQRRNPTPQQIRERRRIQRGEAKTAGYTTGDFDQTVREAYDEMRDPNANHAKSWNIDDSGADRHGGSGDAGGTPVSQSMSDSGGGAGASSAGGGSTASRSGLAPSYATRGETNIATSTGQILLNPGSMIRMPTGQVLNVKNVRRHESSPDHYYLDTDYGTSVVPWSTNFTMVTRDDQQKNPPNTGMPGGNFGDQNQNRGRVDQSYNRHPGDRDSLEGDAQPNRCGGCGSNGTLTLRGGKQQCSKCGHTQSTGTGGLSFSDATQQYLSRLKDPRSAIQRRVEAVLAQPNQEESL